MCYMILDCCAQQRTYEKFYGLLAQVLDFLCKCYFIRNSKLSFCLTVHNEVL